ncbi:MAG: RNA methyltransferase [Candidatus Latescibacteria bacterium]|nr:RNA methyltransferase [Candidatus Latescibacterota bacterium]
MEFIYGFHVKIAHNPDSFHRTVDVSSSSNKSYKEWKALLTGRGIKRHGKGLVSGAKVVSELINLYPERIKGWITAPDGSPPPTEMNWNIPWYRLNKNLFRELDIYGTGHSLLVVKIPEPVPFREEDTAEKIILLIPFQDPSNIGAVIRSAAAFGVTTVVLLEEAAHPFHPKSIRAAGTPLFTVKCIKGPSINKIDKIGRPVIALSRDGCDVSTFRFPERFAILPGLEGPGLPEGLNADYTVSIPIEPSVESLNAAVATSIVLYELGKKRR